MNDRKGKHLTWNDRLTIERMLLRGMNKRDIAAAVGCCLATIYNEIKRATYLHTTSELVDEVRYNPDEAQRKYEEQLHRKGVKPKLPSCPALVEYIEDMIIREKFSPEAIVLHLKNCHHPFDVDIKAVGTIYDGIRKGYFANLGMEKLPYGRVKKRKERVKRQKRAAQGTSIEKRDQVILTRESCGNWEMDCVVGKAINRKTILVLTERKTRYTILELLKTHTAGEVVKALNRLEKRYGSGFYDIFQTITVDNGSEFSDFEGMEKALRRKGNRTKIYYCHPSAPHERGSNEVGNRLIRRWLPKGTDFDKHLNRSVLKNVEFWMNTYPRHIFDGSCAEEMFYRELNEFKVRGYL